MVKWKRLIPVLAFLLGATLLFRLILSIGWDRILDIVAQVPPKNVLILMALPFVTLLLGALRWALLLSAFKVRIPFRKVILMLLAARSIGYLVPGGTLVELSTLGLLTPSFSVPVVGGVGSIIADGFIRITTHTTLLFAASLGFLAAGVLGPKDPASFLIGMVSGISSIILLLLLFREGSARFLTSALSRVFPERGEIYEHIFRDFRSFFERIRIRAFLAVILSVADFLWEPFQIGVVLSFLGYPLPYFQVFWFYYAIVYPRVIPVPAGLGFSEAGGTAFATATGLGGEVGLTTGLLARLKDLPAVILGLLTLGWFSLRYTSKK
jgi:uncharacterized protein (TIRG00374 family)